MIKHLIILFLISILSGCITFTAVNPGEANVSGMSLMTKTSWNQAPAELSRRYRPDTKIWTQNGMMLDRLIVIPAVPSGQPILRQLSKSQALPNFDSKMLPNEIEELTESSILKMYGEGNAAVEVSNLRPHRFGQDRGIMFDLDIRVSDGPDYKGTTGAFIVDDKLYMIVFLGVIPHYYDTYLAEATEIIKSAKVAK